MNLPNWNDLLSKKGRIVYTGCKASENENKQILLKYYNEMTCSITFCFCDTEQTDPDWKPGENDPNRRRGWSKAGNEKALQIPRHTPHKTVLKVADYVDEYLKRLSLYLPKGSEEYDFIAYEGDTVGNNGSGELERSPENKYGFWLIDPTPMKNVNASRADFVYAIFHTSEFEKHCDKVETDYKTANPKSNSQMHFDLETKWDTFTINHDTKAKLSTLAPSLSPDIVPLFKGQRCNIAGITVEEAIALAGKRLRNGWEKDKFDARINALLGI